MTQQKNLEKSLLDLINVVDNVPPDFNYTTLYRLLLPSDPRPHGFLLPDVVSQLPWTPAFSIDHTARTIQLSLSATASSLPQRDQSALVTAEFQKVVDATIDAKTFDRLLHGEHSEPYQLMGSRYTPRVSLERYIAPLFGITSRGAHMTAYVGPASGPYMRIWVARRAHNLFTYPGLRDTTVAGGVKAADSPLDCVVAEAEEEAGLDRAMVRERAVAAGCVTYVTKGGMYGTVTPIVLYVYDIDLPEDVVPRPMDGEVERFELMDVDDIMDAMKKGEFKPNCCLVMLDFFVRRGVLTPEHTADYVEICSRLRRVLPVPTAP